MYELCRIPLSWHRIQRIASLFLKIQRHEVQSVVLCRIFAPEFSGNGFRFLVPEFKRFQVFFEKGFKVYILLWCLIKGQVGFTLRKKGGRKFQKLLRIPLRQ